MYVFGGWTHAGFACARSSVDIGQNMGATHGTCRTPLSQRALLSRPDDGLRPFGAHASVAASAELGLPQVFGRWAVEAGHHAEPEVLGCASASTRYKLTATEQDRTRKRFTSIRVLKRHPDLSSASSVPRRQLTAQSMLPHSLAHSP